MVVVVDASILVQLLQNRRHDAALRDWFTSTGTSTLPR